MTDESSNRKGDERSESWDVAADWWKERTDSGDPYRELVHGPSLLEACGEVRDLKVLDVGCGAGFFSRELARRVASVQAIDYSSALIDLAIEDEKRTPLSIEYQQSDAARIRDTFEGNSFDLVTGCMSIADIEDLDTAINAVFQVLKPEGRFCFSLPHPLATPPANKWDPELNNQQGGRVIVEYFGRKRVASGLNRISGKPAGPEIKVWHMPISDWFDLLTDAGFTIDRVIEPRPTKGQINEVPDLSRLENVPEFLIVAASRPQHASLG